MSDSQTGSNRRRFLKGTGAAAVSLGLAGCSGGGDDTPEEDTPTEDRTPTSNEPQGDVPTGGTFNIGMSQEPDGINVLNTNSAYSSLILNEIHGYGTSVNPVTSEVVPSVFTDWEFEELDETGDNDQSNVRVRINVRDGLTFNDGSELSVSDVVFSYNYVMEQQPGAYVSYIDPILEVSESDSSDWDVDMILNQPLGTYDSTQLGFIPILAESEWSDVDDYQTYEPSPDADGELLGLGPAVLTRYEPDTSIEISYADREGEYLLSDVAWKEETNGLIAGGPFVDAVRVFVYGSDNALNQAFLQGEIDSMYDGINTSRISDVEEAEGLSLVDGYDTGYSHYSMNLRNAPFDDVTFRQIIGFAYDEIYRTERLGQGYLQSGDFVMPPGYTQVRPETSSDTDVLTADASEAFAFRESEPGVVDVEGVREFLTNGDVISGEEGEFAGRQYPGSHTGVTASQTESKYEYTFGEVESSVLADAGADQEIRIDGQTVTELRDGEPLTFYITPAEDGPQAAQMMENFIGTLHEIGIPVEREVNTFNTMLTSVYVEEDFDLYPMGWVNLSPFAVSTLYGLFHSANADDHSEGNSDTDYNNPMGYGLFEDATADDLIERARTEMDADTRNDLARQAVEQIYLDMPSLVTSYDIVKWPVNDADWDGFVGNIPGPGSTYLGTQFEQVYQAE
ncbi:ABC transporter substrate-binding protein [Halorarum salinum]|uniref:Twin-arginine translocation signal domain-containing protein n=1 Tax=Halorarum salinum TaxID=2743089 RepID=A0A7D5LBH7_9EURY|nr:ABC transporter substrate-binding protein [Halobaculum salinum]QLG62926.1 twin-arginine translocation signal domain-containing protein [Halobaculum salinum]